jgi:1,4-dihydroxy-2-naphthoate octaprenyltransferase
VLGAIAAALLILGSYPLTQVFQIAEDARRGDRTIAVAWGAPAAFRLALVCQALGGMAFAAVLHDLYGWPDAVLVGLGVLAQMAAVAMWSQRFDARDVLGGYRAAMRLNAASAAALTLYLLARLLLLPALR